MNGPTDQRAQVTDGPMDGWMEDGSNIFPVSFWLILTSFSYKLTGYDGPTDNASYRDARKHLKTQQRVGMVCQPSRSAEQTSFEHNKTANDICST